MTTQTTAIDADTTSSDSKVIIQYHPVDQQNLAEDVGERIMAMIQTEPMGCHYFNPVVTVSCPTPSRAFFRKVRREQSRWCRQSSRIFSRRTRRGVKKWVSHEWIDNKYARYLNRGACLTGLLFYNGRLVPAHEWRSLELISHEITVHDSRTDWAS